MNLQPGTYSSLQTSGDVIMNDCPNCGEALVHANLGDGTVDIYCEECGWPDECLPAPPPCVICGAAGVGVVDNTHRCEACWDHKLK